MKLTRREGLLALIAAPVTALLPAQKPPTQPKYLICWPSHRKAVEAILAATASTDRF